jgi:CheY-like chemotaxis protein
MSHLETPIATAIVFCPACGARYVANVDAIVPNVVVLCTACGKGSVLGALDAARTAPTTDLIQSALREAEWPRVVVGHEVPAAARSIADTLRRGKLSPVVVRTGDEVLAAVDPTMPSQPAAVVLDVGIPGILAFEIIEAVRAQPSTKNVPVVLLASVYERTRYKRRPNRLYGADAYLELHHVPDRLVDLVTSLMKHEPAGDERQQAPVDRARAAGLRSDGPEVRDNEGARALARRLLSDVALYHGDEVAQGIRDGAPFSLLDDALTAAADLFRRAGGSDAVFAEERTSFEQRLGSAKGLGGRSLG